MPAAIALAELYGKRSPIAGHRPWPRYSVDHDTWCELAGGLARYPWTLLGLWAEPQIVYMALYHPSTESIPNNLTVVSLACPDGRYPAVSQWHPPALRLERSIADLFGLIPENLPDPRPWLDHGCWPERHPLGNTLPYTPAAQDYVFLAAEGEALHQIPVGPVHAGIIEPGHFRFSASGETVVRLEQRLGYVHKGIEKLLQGATLEQGARLVGRISGDSTVAYALAYARAIEAALVVAIPQRAHWLRALMAELERLSNHFGDIGAICNDAAFALMHAHCGVLREQVLQASAQCFGHRLLMDRIVPGGCTSDLDTLGSDMFRALLADIRRSFPELIELYENTASLKDRTDNTGIVQAELVRRYGAGGFVGRSAGRDFDARRQLAYPPYPQLDFTVPVLHRGDVNARVWLRISEVEQSLGLIEQMLDAIPAGPVYSALQAGGPAEGMAVVEGFRGDILIWLRLAADGTLARCHPRDPSWFQWPLLEAAIEGNIVADFPLCNKSFNCSYSGVDL
jgi:Ni,Fe-hydrogenase III large subunit